MTPSFFLDKNTPPDEQALSSVLGESLARWESLLRCIQVQSRSLVSEWRNYSAKYGWTLVVKDRKRNILYLTPQAGGFTAAFVFGDRAVAAVEASELPESIKQSLRKARKYMEGRGIVVDVKTEDDLRNVEVLIKIKLASWQVDALRRAFANEAKQSH